MPEPSIVLVLVLVTPSDKTLIQADRQTLVAFSFNAADFDRRRSKTDNEHEHDWSDWRTKTSGRARGRLHLL